MCQCVVHCLFLEMIRIHVTFRCTLSLLYVWRSVQIMDPLLPKKRTSSPQSCIAIAVFGLLFLVSVIAIICFISFGSTTHNEHGHTLSNHAFIEEEFFNDSIKSYYSPNGEDDLVESMINLDYDSCSDSPTNCGFNQYSGYLKATNDHEIHYWFFEADTEDDPTTKPIFFWTNGGPSCSGAMGLFTEQGPWRVLENMTVIYNPNTWITEVNMVFLEQPYGVGFSVVDPSLHPVAGDQNAAEDMDAMIRNFLVKFPRYLENEVYTTAESWGLFLEYSICFDYEFIDCIPFIIYILLAK